MKKLKRERKKFNRDYLKPLVGCGILFVLIVAFMIIFGYNPKENNNENKKTDNYHLNIDDKTISQNTSCDTNFYKSVIEEVNKIDLSFKVVTVEGEKIVDNENSTDDEIVYFTREYYGYEMTMNNIPDGVKAVVTDNKTENVYNVSKDQKTFTSIYTNSKVTYIVNVYGDSENCKDVLLRQFNFVTPIFNSASETTVCENNGDENCALVSYNETDISDVVQKQIEETIEKEKENKSNTIKIIIGVVLIVIIIAVVVIIYYRKRRKRMVM